MIPSYFRSVIWESISPAAQVFFLKNAEIFFLKNKSMIFQEVFRSSIPPPHVMKTDDVYVRACLVAWRPNWTSGGGTTVNYQANESVMHHCSVEITASSFFFSVKNMFL